MLTRRSFLQRSLQLPAALALRSNGWATSDHGVTLRMKLGEEPAVSLPTNFTGLGYEMSSVARLGRETGDRSQDERDCNSMLYLPVR